VKGKITLLVGGAVGYVLGTRAGRERYDEIVSQARGLWENPKVQEQAHKATDLAKEKAPEVQKKVADAASSASSAAKSKVSSDSSSDSSSSLDSGDVTEPAIIVDPAGPPVGGTTPYPTTATTGLNGPA
jgi:SLT domain-containing protein